MNRTYFIAVMLAAFFACFSGCETPTDKNQGGEVTVVGQVLDSSTDLPVREAVVQVLDVDPPATTFTDDFGQFSLRFEINGSSEVRISVYKESYLADTTKVLAIPERRLEIPYLRLTPTSDTPTNSGDAASVILSGQSVPYIGVKESGSPESAQLVFEVQDSSGQPIDLNHAVEVRFRIGSGPGGGEFLHPTQVTTDAGGHAITYIFSGTRAGAVQIIAEVDNNGEIIRSLPVAMSIHGGLPDSLHFSVAVEKLNFPGYNIFGLTDQITAYVGDKYGNPVRPNTSVYFTTSGGIIEGSSQTSLQGEASVNLISAEPRPTHPTYGPGFATVTASTADENQNTIYADAIVLFSGVPQLSISPSSFNIPNGGAQTFIYTVSDQNGNPLAGGTGVTVAVSGENINVLGTTDVNIPDTQSRGWTSFAFTIADAVDTVEVAKPVSIEITTSGPNGGALLNIGGISN